MNAESKAIHFTPDEGEERARAELYGLLAALYYATPSESLLKQIASAPMPTPVSAPGEGGFLEQPWQQLVAAARSTNAAAVAEEYDALFGGVGKPEVMLYASYYLTGFLNEKPLAALREVMQSFGLDRHEGVFESEDHVACLYEVMRYLIEGDDAAVANLSMQRKFFTQQLQPWVEKLCDAIEAHPRASLYRCVAAITYAFTQVEMQAFDMLG